MSLETKEPPVNYSPNETRNISDKYSSEDIAYLHKYIYTNRFIPSNIRPFEEQIDLLLKKDRKMLIYGSAGLGKTILDLIIALRYCDTPDFICDTVLVRNTYKDFSNAGGFLFLLKKWLKKHIEEKTVIYDNWNKQFTFPNGSTITLQYLQNDNDLDNLLGTEYQQIIIDEAVRIKSNFLEIAPTRLRGGVGDFQKQFILTTNSFGQSTDWLLENYIEGDVGTAYYVDVTENPYQEKEYIDELDNLPPFLKEIYRYGNFKIKLMDGALITLKRLQQQMISKFNLSDFKEDYKIGIIYGAGEGKDDVGLAICGKRKDTGEFYIYDTYSVDLIDYEETAFNYFVNNKVYNIYFEDTQTGDSRQAKKYLKSFLTTKKEYEDIIFKTVKTKGKSKYIRNKPFVLSVHRGESSILERGDSFQLQKEILSLHPDPDIMKNVPSPNLLDCCGYGYNILKKDKVSLLEY